MRPISTRPISTPPTGRQAAVLGFIREVLLAQGRPPTLREICAHLGISSPNGVMCHIRSLVRRGLLRAAGERRSNRRYLPVAIAVATVDADGSVRLATTGAVTYTPAEWREQLAAWARDLGAAA